MKKVYVGECRRGHFVIIPCNWNVNGFCGVDGRKCIIEHFFEEGEIEEYSEVR